MTIQLKKYQTNSAETGYVAYFDVHFDCGMTARGLALLRPVERPNVGWLMFPMLARESRRSIGMTEELMQLIGTRACLMYQAMTGTALEFQLPPNVHTTDEKKPRVVKSSWLSGDRESHEPDDAGLRRVLGDAERDSLEMAGI
ncbi:hypothetical protein ACQKP1_07630 [Allorhizobium sp. NPDC080224]|uniref:hypothetical protein n=1 Tax=Allorhizobium sp. NPDC080224 TaxID=3390547 RepID=UPI003D08DDF5